MVEAPETTRPVSAACHKARPERQDIDAAMIVEAAVLVFDQQAEIVGIDTVKVGRQPPALVASQERREDPAVPVGDQLRAQAGARHVGERDAADSDFQRGQDNQRETRRRGEGGAQAARHAGDHCGPVLSTVRRPTAVHDVVTGIAIGSTSVGGRTNSPAALTRT